MKITKFASNQVGVTTKSREYYFTKERGNIIMDIFNANVQDSDKARIGGDIFTFKDFNVSRNIGKKGDQKVKELLGLQEVEPTIYLNKPISYMGKTYKIRRDGEWFYVIIGNIQFDIDVYSKEEAKKWAESYIRRRRGRK